jgi:membrane-bound ClpP family serine protease
LNWILGFMTIAIGVIGFMRVMFGHHRYGIDLFTVVTASIYLVIYLVLGSIILFLTSRVSRATSQRPDNGLHNHAEGPDPALCLHEE